MGKVDKHTEPTWKEFYVHIWAEPLANLPELIRMRIKCMNASPYVLGGFVTVSQGVILTVESGVVVKGVIDGMNRGHLAVEGIPPHVHSQQAC